MQAGETIGPGLISKILRDIDLTSAELATFLQGIGQQVNLNV